MSPPDMGPQARTPPCALSRYLSSLLNTLERTTGSGVLTLRNTCGHRALGNPLNSQGVWFMSDLQTQALKFHPSVKYEAHR